MKNTFFILSFLISLSISAQDLQPFKIYTADGKLVKNKNFIKKLLSADVVLFGELHDNSMAHWLELQVIKNLHTKKNISVGMEMFEADNQDVLDAYLSDKISAKQLDSLARLWNNFKTDYKPIVDFCKQNNLPVVATNIPRRYASLVFKQGEMALINLPNIDKQWFPNLPMPYDENLASYQAMLKMFGDATHANKNFPKSQAIKDYTMASNIIKNFIPSTVFVHFNGSYHSDNYEGINWYLKYLKPELKVITISTVLQSDLNKLEIKNKNIANYIIVTDSDTIRTY